MENKIENNFCEIKNNNLKSQLIQKNYGIKEDNLILKLDLFETMYLFEKNKIKIKNISNISELEKYCLKKIKNFKDKYLVFKDFRNNGYIIKDGLKFGFDFKIYENEKSKKHNHTKYVVDVKRSHKDQMSKIIKSERLANSIKTKYIVAIIDLENKITKIKIERI
ncbi:MAG: tRNA-intron lyase [Candidatus ainarchaeum sp.]|nr:tRNA-intron lyase [Candidatus ainarchaeum sp.]MDD3976237.1 tRNA-intron lyase [Candidatus ainarchaeum sp.]